MKHRLHVCISLFFIPFIMSSCCLIDNLQESDSDTGYFLLFFYIVTIIAALLDFASRMESPEIEHFQIDGKWHTRSTGRFLGPAPEEGIDLSCGVFSLYIAGVIGYFLFDIVEDTNLLIKLFYFIACLAFAIFIWTKAKILVNIIRIISYIFVFSDIIIGIGMMLWNEK